MPFDVRPHEGTQRNDRALGSPFGIEGGGDERRTDAFALEVLVDLGVDEDRPATTA